MTDALKKKLDAPSALADRYARRSVGDRYSMLRPEVWHGVQERQRAILGLFAHDLCWKDLGSMTLTEVGCGGGGNLLDFLRFGLSAQNMCGIELLPERVAAARMTLPATLAVHEADANSIDIAANSQDVVFQSVVFSSLLDDGFQHALASRMWEWVKPGGGVLWYDFIYNNPKNPDVRGVPIKRIKELFPEGQIHVWRLTLAPPISRVVTRLHPSLYTVFNMFPFLRSHVLCWIQKSI